MSGELTTIMGLPAVNVGTTDDPVWALRVDVGEGISLGDVTIDNVTVPPAPDPFDLQYVVGDVQTVTLEVGDGASGLPSPPAGATHAEVTVEGDALRFKAVGDAAIDQGHLLWQGQTYMFGSTHAALLAVSLFSTGSTQVQVTYRQVPA